MLNENLKNLRKQKGFTQEEIASRLHVVRQTVSKWEKAFWNILTVIGIVVLLWGLSGIGFGTMNYSAAIHDPAYSA